MKSKPNKTKMWRSIGAAKGAKQLQAQADGVRASTPRQTTHFLRAITRSIPSRLLQALMLRAGIVQPKGMLPV